ncbi:hypothetical protein [Pseudomonas sp. BRG-100]|uniref:hypothetical protein n=1 Tax=Pseudomonas sp. BRG-100 TaxID=1524267 RepID=UPI000AA0FBBB|nr:hypothetical protein [Pseudomonas sp. BRG-100]
MSISKAFSVYEANSFFAGKKMNIPYKEQIKIIANDLLEKNADVNILPEFSSGLIQSGQLQSLPDRIADPIQNTVKDTVSWGLNWLPLDIGNFIGGLASGVLGAVVKLPLTMVTQAVTKIGLIGPLGSITESVLDSTVGKALSAVVKEVGGVPTENLFSGDHARLKDIVDYMNTKAGGEIYKHTLHGTTATISKYDMLDTKSNGIAAGGSSFVIDLDSNGVASSGDIHFDTIHTNDKKYAAYLPRGASNDGPTPGKITTDLAVIKHVNLESGRKEAITAVINSHENSAYNKLAHVIVGDFNEPSHLDWVDSTKNLYDHNGVIYAWDTSKKLEAKGYTDSYREIHSNPVKDPGHTWGGPAYEVGNKSWTSADDRDRIDFIYYKDGEKIDLATIESSTTGSNEYFLKGESHQVTVNDSLMSHDSKMPWYSDHKGVYTNFNFSEVPTSIVGQPLVETL